MMSSKLFSCLSAASLMLSIVATAEPVLKVTGKTVLAVNGGRVSPLSEKQIKFMNRGYFPFSYQYPVVAGVTEKYLFLNLIFNNTTMNVYTYPASLANQPPGKMIAARAYMAGISGEDSEDMLVAKVTEEYRNSTVFPYDFIKAVPYSYKQQSDGHYSAEALPVGSFYGNETTLTEGKSEIPLAGYKNKMLMYFYRDVHFGEGEGVQTSEEDRSLFSAEEICPQYGCKLLTLVTKTAAGYLQPKPLIQDNQQLFFVYDQQLNLLIAKRHSYGDDYNPMYRFDLNQNPPTKTQLDISSKDISPIGLDKDGKVLGYLYNSSGSTCYGEVSSAVNYILKPDDCPIPLTGVEGYWSSSMVYSEDYKYAVLPCGDAIKYSSCYSHLYSADHKQFWRVDAITETWDVFDESHSTSVEKVTVNGVKSGQFRVFIRGVLKQSGATGVVAVDLMVVDDH